MRIGSATRLTTGAADSGAAVWATGANETGWTGGAASTAVLTSVRTDNGGRSATRDAVGGGRTVGRPTAEPLAGRPRRPGAAPEPMKHSTGRRLRPCPGEGWTSTGSARSRPGGKRLPVAVHGFAWTGSAGVASWLRVSIRAANPLSGAVGAAGSTASTVERTGSSGTRPGEWSVPPARPGGAARPLDHPPPVRTARPGRGGRLRCAGRLAFGRAGCAEPGAGRDRRHSAESLAGHQSIPRWGPWPAVGFPGVRARPKPYPSRFRGPLPVFQAYR